MLVSWERRYLTLLPSQMAHKGMKTQRSSEERVKHGGSDQPSVTPFERKELHRLTISGFVPMSFEVSQTPIFFEAQAV